MLGNKYREFLWTSGTLQNLITDRKLYPAITTTYLHLPAAKALAIIQLELKRKCLSLKLFDAYRPYRVTKKM